MARKLSNDELWDRISEAGIFRDKEGGEANDLDGAVLAGAATIQVTDGSGFVQDKWYRLGSGDKMELFKLKTIAANVLTPYSPIALDHADAEAVVEAERVRIGEVSEEGVKRSTTLDRNPIKTATTRGVFAYLIRGIEQALEWLTPNHSLENVALSLGIPESAITGTGVAATPYRLVIKEAAVATLNNISYYFTGATLDGTTFEFQGWGVDTDGSGDMTYTSGDAPGVRIAGNVKNMAIYSPALA